MKNTVLSINNATLFNNNVCIVKNFSLNIKHGDIIFITGDNGAGKSSLMKCLIKLKKLKIGNLVTLKDKSYIPQSIKLSQHIPLKTYELIQLLTNERIDVFNSFKEYKHLLNKKYNELSGGEMKLIWLLSIIKNKDEVLFLDEPLENLDVKNRIKITEKLKASQKTLIITSHCKIKDLNADIIINLNNKTINYFHNNALTKEVKFH